MRASCRRRAVRAENNVQRLQEDRDNAAWMAEQLRAIGADVTRHDTNMLFVRVGEEQAPALGKFMQAQVLITPACCPSGHSPDVNRQQLSEVVAHWQAFLQRKESGVSQSVLVLMPAAILASIWCAH